MVWTAFVEPIMPEEARPLKPVAVSTGSFFEVEWTSTAAAARVNLKGDEQHAFTNKHSLATLEVFESPPNKTDRPQQSARKGRRRKSRTPISEPG